MDRVRIYIISAALLSALLFSLFPLLGAEGYFGTLSNLIIVLLGFLCAGTLYLSHRALIGKAPEAASGFVFLFASVLLWAVAEGIWLYSAAISAEEIPYPSIADLFWLAGYAPFVYALYLFFRSIKFQSKAAIIAIVTYIVLGALLGYSLKDAIIDSEAEPIANIVSVAYILGDLILLALAIPLILAFFSRPLGLSWLIIGLSLVAIAIGDVLFLQLTASGEYSDSHILNLFYMLSYLWLGTGALMGAAERKKIR